MDSQVDAVALQAKHNIFKAAAAWSTRAGELKSKYLLAFAAAMLHGLGSSTAHTANMSVWTAGATGALLSYGTTQLLADRTMASAIGNASRRSIAAGMHPNKLMVSCMLS